MNLEQLQSVRDSERRTDSLQQLRESFYADAGEFIQELREKRERAAERAEDPFDAPEVDRLTSEIKAAEETVEAIYEKRLGKLVKTASLAAADMHAETEGMTAEEQQLFETLVADIRSNRQHVLDVLAGERTDPGEDASGEDSPSVAGVAGEGPSARSGTADSPATDSERTAPADGERAESPDRADAPEGSVAAADAMGESEPTPESGTGSGPGSDSEASPADGHERETVRITADVGAIFGVDEREYDLSEDDVVQLPAANAEPLLDRDAAERL